MKTFIATLIESQWYTIDIDDFEDFNNHLSLKRGDTIISFQISDLIRELKKEISFIPVIIDLESLDKQMSQEGSDLENNRSWKMLTKLKEHKILDSDFKLSKITIRTFLESIATFYKNLLGKDTEEFKRFNSIEKEVNKIIYKAQYNGININPDVVKSRCAKLEEEIYEIKNIMQLDHGIFDPDNEKCQIDYLANKKYPLIKSFLHSFKSRRKKDVVCNLFYELIRKKADQESLLYILAHWGGETHTYPSYIGFGTITSRIILRQPALQNLRKSNRDIIVPNLGFKLLYVDYSQFEAGILASLSDDDTLIDLYNSDIYRDLACNALNTPEDRSEAKIVFYRYIYGDTTLDKSVIQYFNRFKKLQIFREQVEKEILEKRKIGSSNANYRIASNHECTWSLSHKIQSTASLIYKSALIKTHRELSSKAELLIPMHDGTVYQISEIFFEETKLKIEEIYKEVFKRYCPKIQPIVNSSEYFN